MIGNEGVDRDLVDSIGKLWSVELWARRDIGF
jgi:hypothetical protein